MMIPLSLTEEEAEQFKQFAKLQNRTVPEMIRAAVREKIQNENDWRKYKEALADYQIDPRVVSLKEIKRERGIR